MTPPMAQTPTLIEAGPTEFAIVLRPLASSIPATARLKSALKSLLRSYGLRCTDCREIPASRPQRRRAR